MAQNKAFLTAFIAGMTAPASLLAPTNPYTAYMPRTPLAMHFAAVGMNISRAASDYESGRTKQSTAKLPLKAA